LIDRLRKTNRRPNTDSLEDILTEPVNSRDKDLQMSVEAKEAAQAMKNLRPEQRQILHLSIVQGYSHQEIADALAMPLGTVKTHARRGLLQVRELLGLGNSDYEKEAVV
jgi:RNA polymerase sigma factor (sigma-70 family)